MKIGDKVRFLNSTGGGVVKNFQGKDIALVEDNDGFDIPVLIRECVVISPANEAQVRQAVQPKAVEPSFGQEKVSKQEIGVPETKEGEEITACLAYLPVDIKSLTTTNYECYLVNDSNYFLTYTYLSRANAGWCVRASGTIEPNTKLFLDEFSKTDINDLEKICVQFVAYKHDKPFRLKNPCSAEVRIDTVKFYKLHSFKENDYFEDDAIIYYLMRKDLVEKELTVIPEVLGEAMMQRNDKPRPRIQQIKKKEQSSILEIDLHIEELVDTTAGLEAADMLAYQLSKFDEIMSDNKTNKGQKIVFIHGKGNGVLKTAILEQLKTKYKTMYYQDASFREYGFGATMVTIK
ncbi:MAG: hypothetical protein RL662_1877 [Bacteroidota bacterium]|jgi:DNA-nicking Smr family endonuclease